MKKQMNIALTTALALALALAGCRKDPEAVSETVTVDYPVITLKGDKYVSIGIGGSFNDPGASMFDKFTNTNTDIQPSQSDVDVNTPGMYPIIYEGTNKYGFKSTAVRWVAVTEVSANEDISGLYLRNINASPMNVNKVATGIYKVDNIGGVNGVPEYIYDMYFVQTSDTTVNFPAQPGPFGTTYTTSETLTKSPSDTTLAWRVMGAGFGTAVRTFNRQ